MNPNTIAKEHVVCQTRNFLIFHFSLTAYQKMGIVVATMTVGSISYPSPKSILADIAPAALLAMTSRFFQAYFELFFFRHLLCIRNATIRNGRNQKKGLYSTLRPILYIRVGAMGDSIVTAPTSIAAKRLTSRSIHRQNRQIVIAVEKAATVRRVHNPMNMRSLLFLAIFWDILQNGYSNNVSSPGADMYGGWLL